MWTLSFENIEMAPPLFNLGSAVFMHQNIWACAQSKW